MQQRCTGVKVITVFDFFVQAEDGIRVYDVTGVQTCALPILSQGDILKLISQFPDLRTKNVAFRNNRDGTFSDYSAKWRFDQPGVSQGMALADLDNDGDMDVVMNNLLEAAGIYENQATGSRVRVELRGSAGNRFAVGAKVAIRQDGGVQTQEIISSARYLSSDQSIRTFGGREGAFDIRVTASSGHLTRVASSKDNHASLHRHTAV